MSPLQQFNAWVQELNTIFLGLPKAAQVWITWALAIFMVILTVLILRMILSRIVFVWMKNHIKSTRYNLDDQLLSALERPIRVLTIGAGIALVTVLFDFNADADRIAESASSALVILAAFLFLYSLVDIIGFTSETLRRITGLDVQERLLPFMRTVVKGFILVMGLLIVLQEFGYNVTGLVASFGVVGLAFSLAAQDTAANIFGFTAIVSDNPFQVGDYIVTSSFAGTVEHVGVRSTRVRKLDQSVVYVPNSQLTDAPVTNWSRLSKRRLDFILGVTYNTNSAQMREFVRRLREMLKARETVDPDSVIVHFIEFGGSSLDIRIIAAILLADWGEFTAETELINLEIMEIVEEMGLSVAFPSQSVYIETMPLPSDRPKEQEVFAPTLPDSPADERGEPEHPYQDNESESNDMDDASER